MIKPYTSFFLTLKVFFNSSRMSLSLIFLETLMPVLPTVKTRHSELRLIREVNE